MTRIDFDQIREKNLKRYGTDIGRIGKLIFEDNYTNKTHFILELLQNAEDSIKRRGPGWKGSRAIEFNLTKDELRIKHQGDPFNKADILGICNIGESTKDELTAIGHFGIGFKSVYAYTDQPEIHSGSTDDNIDFLIENYVWPKAIRSINRIDSEETVLILPFKPEEKDDGYQDISNALKNLGARTILFLREIEEIQWHISNMSGTYSRKSKKIDDSVRQVTVTGISNGKEPTSEEWLIFSHPVTNEEDCYAGDVEVAFWIEPNSQRIHPIEASPLVVYFPTGTPTGVRFLIQGPYKTTPDREKVPKGNPWNSRLRKATATLLEEALYWIRDNSKLDAQVLRCLPLITPKGSSLGDGAARVLMPGEERLHMEGDMFDSLYFSTKKLLSNQSLIPRLKGGYISAEQALMARSQDVRDLLSPEQLQQIYNTKQAPDWISSDITQDRMPDLYEYLHKKLGVKLITPKSIVRKLNNNFLENQSDEWMICFYEFLGRHSDLRNMIQDKPIIRLEDGRHVTPKDKAFLPSDKISTDFPTVHPKVCNKQTIEFLKSIGIEEPDPVDDVIQNILTKYKSETPSIEEIDKTTYISDVNRIVRAYETDSIEKRQKLIGELKQTPFVKGADIITGFQRFVRPNQLYLATDQLKELSKLSRLKKIFFLANDHFNSNNKLREILERCGAIDHLRPIPGKLTSDKMSILLRRHKKKSSHRNDRGNDWDLDKLSEIILALSEPKTRKDRKRIAELLWDELIYIRRRKGYIFTETYTFTHHGKHSILFDANFVEQLNRAKWIPDEEGVLQSPKNITFEELGWKGDIFLLDKIKFKPPIIEQLAEQAGFEPSLLVELERQGITTLSALLEITGPITNGKPSPGDGEPSPGDSNKSMMERLLERTSRNIPDPQDDPVISPTVSPKTRESIKKFTRESNRRGRSGHHIPKTVQIFEPTKVARDLAQIFRDMVKGDYNYRCQICGTAFKTEQEAFQTFVTHIIKPAQDFRTNHPGNLLDLCGWHYALISYGQWKFLHPKTQEPIDSREMMEYLFQNPHRISLDNGNDYKTVTIRFYNIYEKWESKSKWLDEVIYFCGPHWESFCKRFEE